MSAPASDVQRPRLGGRLSKAAAVLAGCALSAAALANTSIPWAADAYTKTSQLIKVLEKRTSDIIKTVFGSSKSQIKFVLAIQYVWSDGSTPGFEFALSQFGDLSQVFDCVGTAPYFQVDNSQTDNLNDIFANISSVWLNPDPATPSSIAGFITSNLAFAQKYNLTLISYEGGQALSSSTNPNLIVAAQNDPRMYAMYQTYIGLWNSIVGHDHLFTHFTDVSAQYGNNSWGLLVHENDPGSQKWDALMSLSQIPGDANYDGVVDSQDCEILQSNFGQTGTWWAEGDFNHDGVVDAKDLAILNASAPNLNCAITD